MSSFIFNHIALSVKNVDASIAFYQSIFNFKEIENTASNSKTRWLSINEDKQLHLIPRPDSEIKTDKALHFAFSTPNFDSFIRTLEDLDIEFSDWKDTPNKDYIRKDGIRQVYFQDPNDYWIEVNEAK